MTAAPGWPQALDEYEAFLDDLEASLGTDDWTDPVEPWQPETAALGEPGEDDLTRFVALQARAAALQAELEAGMGAVREELAGAGTRRTAARAYLSHDAPERRTH